MATGEPEPTEFTDVVIRDLGEEIPDGGYEALYPVAVAEDIGAVITEVVAVAKYLEDKVAPGTIFERTERGWKVTLMYGGAPRLFGEGATIKDAFTAAGL